MTGTRVGKIKYCSFHEGRKTDRFIDLDMYDVLNNQYSYTEMLDEVTIILEDTLDLDLTLIELIICADSFGDDAPVCRATYKIRGSNQTLEVGFDSVLTSIKY